MWPTSIKRVFLASFSNELIVKPYNFIDTSIDKLKDTDIGVGFTEAEAIDSLFNKLIASKTELTMQYENEVLNINTKLNKIQMKLKVLNQ